VIFTIFTPKQRPATHMPTCANSDLCTVTTPTNGGFRLRPTRWRPDSGSSWYKHVLK